MRVSDDLKCDLTDAPYHRSEPRTATLLTLPTSRHHTIRSVAQQAFKSLWTEEPDRAERWRRVGNMDEVFGVGRPLRTISKQVVAAAIGEMKEMGIPWPLIDEHFKDFGSLMTWAVGQDFAEWG